MERLSITAALLWTIVPCDRKWWLTAGTESFDKNIEWHRENGGKKGGCRELWRKYEVSTSLLLRDSMQEDPVNSSGSAKPGLSRLDNFKPATEVACTEIG